MKKILLLLLIFISTNIYAQIDKSFVICDELLSPVSYASVYAKDTNYGTYSNYNGYVELKVFPEDTLIISCIGYINKKIKVSGISDTLILSKSTITLRKAIVKEEYDYPIIGYDRRKTFRSGRVYGLSGSINGIVIQELAFCKLQDISLNIYHSSDSSCTKFMLLLCEVDDSTNLPTNSLLSKPFFFDDSKKGWSTINIDSLNIYIEGKIFIGVEIVPNLDLISEDSWDVQDLKNSEYTMGVYNKDHNMICIEGRRGLSYHILDYYNLFPMIRATIKN